MEVAKEDHYETRIFCRRGKQKDKLFTIIYADILNIANVCQFLLMPKMEKAGCHSVA